MFRNVSSRIIVGCAIAASAVACGDRDRVDMRARGHEGAPIQLTGCLQKQDGVMDSYLLTQVNAPAPASVGTSGSVTDAAKSGGAAVKNEQLREAKHAYALSGDKDQLDRLVGKQVSVQGVITENSDLHRKADGDKKADRPLDVDAGDLAKVKVNSIAQVSDACGDSSAPRQ